MEVYARGQTGVLKAAGYDVTDLSFAVFTYDDGSVVNLGICYALPEKYPALGHAARVEMLGTEGVMILDDDHTDQLMYSEKGVPHVYLPDHSVNMVFLQSGTPGDWALGEFWGRSPTRPAPGSIIWRWASRVRWRPRSRPARRSKPRWRSNTRWRPASRDAAAQAQELFYRARSKPRSR